MQEKKNANPEKKHFSFLLFSSLFLPPLLSNARRQPLVRALRRRRGASVRSGASARVTAAPQQQQQRKQRLADAPLSSKNRLAPAASECRPSLLSVVQASASAAQSTELPPELKRIVTAFSMVRSLFSIVGERETGWNRCLMSFFPLTTTTTTKTTKTKTKLSTSLFLLSQVPDPKLKYAQLLAYGKKLDPLPAGVATEANKVRGCVSQVWVVPVLDKETGLVTWLADSDSALTKGLAALLAKGLSGVRPSVVASMSPDFITELGLAQSLTPSRNNGF